MTIDRVTGRGYLLRPFFVGYARGLWNAIGGSNVQRVPFYGLGKDFKFKREGVTS